MKTCFELKTISANDEISTRRSCDIISRGIYSTLDKAQSGMMSDIESAEKYGIGHYFGYIIEEKNVDSETPYMRFKTYRTYNSHGEPNDECLIDYNAENSFYGRKPEDIKFSVGDIVWALQYHELVLCIVGWLPPTTAWYQERKASCLKKYGNADRFYLDATDDSYGLYTLGDGDTHCHVLCPMVFPSGKEVPEKAAFLLRKKLEEKKAAD